MATLPMTRALLSMPTRISAAQPLTISLRWSAYSTALLSCLVRADSGAARITTPRHRS